MADSQSKSLGFWDYVKRPWLFDRLVRSMAWKPRRGTPDDAQIRKAIRGFLSREPSRRQLEWLQRAGPALLPALLDALRDPAIIRAPKYSDHAVADTPLQTVLDLLQPLAAVEAVEPLSTILRETNGDQREYVALALGSIGAPDCVEPLVKALSDSDAQVRSFAIMGVQYAIKDGHAAEGYLKAVFEPVASLLGDSEYGPADHAPICLLQIDRQRATEMLSGPSHFTRDNDNLLFQLRALNAEEVVLRPDIITGLMQSIRPDATKYPGDAEYAELLILLARAIGDGAAAECRSAMEWGNENVRSGACAGLAIADGVGNARDFVFCRVEQVGESALTESQRAYYVLSILDAEVRNGGFHQYYFNSSGEGAVDAPTLARLVGAEETARVIGRANALFGTDGPPRNRRQRQRRLAAFTPSQDDELDHLNDEYYGLQEKLEAILPFFATQRADEFREPEGGADQL